MPFPEWVNAQKREGFEIKKIGNGFYMYKRESKWDKVKKKAIKVTGEYIGVVTPDGIMPSKKRIDESKPVFSLEYGATAYIKFLADDILETLFKHFDKKTAQQIWVISMLRLISPSPFRRIEEHCYVVTPYTCNIWESPLLNFDANARGHMERASDLTVPGIGHSVIRGLDTAGQWSAASSAVYKRESQYLVTMST